jgi:hypothetical protein
LGEKKKGIWLLVEAGLLALLGLVGLDLRCLGMRSEERPAVRVKPVEDDETVPVPVPATEALAASRKDEKTESFMSSLTVSTASRSSSGRGGRALGHKSRSRSRTCEGTLISRGAQGTRYAWASFSQREYRWALPLSTGPWSRIWSYAALYRCASMVNSSVSRQWFWER